MPLPATAAHRSVAGHNPVRKRSRVPRGRCAINHEEGAHGIVAEMTGATVPGSYLTLTQPAKDINADEVAAGARRSNQRVTVP